MVRESNIESKLAFLRATLARLVRYQTMTSSELTANQDIRAAVERYLYLAVQSAIDAAEMYCKLKQLGRPESMAAAIELVRSAGVIDTDMAGRLIKMVGFRNILSHSYEILDYQIVEAVLKSGLKDLEEFASSLER